MIRQAIAREQLEAAREELHRQQENIEGGGLRDVGRLWLAEDRVWHWSLQVEAGRLTEAPEHAERHPFQRQTWPADRIHEYGNIFCAVCGKARQAQCHQ